MAKAENFFKHADNDADALLDFNPEATEIYLLDSVVTYETLTYEAVPMLTVFKMWMFIQKPELMNDKYREVLLQYFGSDLETLKQVPKAKFFELALPVLTKTGIV